MINTMSPVVNVWVLSTDQQNDYHILLENTFHSLEIFAPEKNLVTKIQKFRCSFQQCPFEFNGTITPCWFLQLIPQEKKYHMTEVNKI